MTENKRFVNENDGDIRDTSTMIKYYCLSLTGKELCDLLNKQEELIKRLKQIREEQIETIFKLKRKIKELEEENGRMKGAFKRKFDYDIEDVVDEICDEDW